MTMSDGEIKQAMAIGQLKIDPLDNPETQIQPASIDLRLDQGFLRYPRNLKLVNLGEGEPPHMRKIPSSQLRLEPGEFALGTTIETVTLSPYLAARVEGRSSLGRSGLAVHIPAGFIDPGFSGQITLELVNLTRHTIVVRSGLRICQLCVFRMHKPAERPYGEERGSKYQGQIGATGSRLMGDWER